MPDDSPQITGDLDAAEDAARKPRSRVHELVHDDNRRVVVEVVRGPGWRVLFLALLTAAVFAGGLGVNGYLKGKRKKPERRSRPPKPKVVDAVDVKTESYRVSVSGLAAAQPSRSLPLVSQLSGRVQSAHPALRPGGFIKKGDVLFTLDDADLVNTIARLEAQISQSKARRRSLKAQLKGAERTIASSRRALKLSKTQLQREETLLAQGHLTAAAVDQTRLTVNSQRERLDTAQTNKDVLPGQIAQAAAEIVAATANLDQARLDLTRVKMVSDIDAQVRTGNLEVGGWVQAGQVLATLDATAAMEIAVAVSLDDLLWIAPTPDEAPTTRDGWAALLDGREAVVSRDGAKPSDRRTWNGVIARVAPGLNERTRMITVYVRVDDPLASIPAHPPLPLLPGMFCTVDIPGKTLNEVVVLPRKAIQGADEVYLIANGDDEDSGNVLRRQKVSVAVVRGEEAVVTAGLKAGDQVITTALPKAMSGMPVARRGAKQKPGVAAR